MASDTTFTFRYPIEISRDLVEMSSAFSQHAMDVHGIGLVGGGLLQKKVIIRCRHQVDCSIRSRSYLMLRVRS